MFGIPHPYPKKAVALNERVGADARSRWNVSVAMRVLYAAAATVEFETMVSAFDDIAANAAEMQRNKAMRTAIFERVGNAGTIPIDQNRLVQNLPR